jgi:hypothetical protein
MPLSTLLWLRSKRTRGAFVVAPQAKSILRQWLGTVRNSVREAMMLERSESQGCEAGAVPPHARPS